MDSQQSIRGDEPVAHGASGFDCNSGIEIGRQLAAKGRHAEALRQFEHVLQMSPESALAYRYAAEQAFLLGDLVSAQDHLALALHYAPLDVASSSLLIQTYIDDKRYPQAQRLARKFLQSQGDNPDLIFQVACCEYWQGQFDLAKTRLSKLLESQPENPAALNLLGLIIAREFGNLEAGEKLIRSALRASPRYKAARSNLGWVVSERGDIVQALDILDRILDEDRDDDETR